MPVPYANLTNPQTLNLYAMVSDNPETFADLDGHECLGTMITGPNGPTCEGPTQPPAGNATGNGPINPDDITKKPSTTQEAQQVIHQAEKVLNWVNNNLGFGGGKSNCAGGGSCANALGMAATAVVAAVASAGESEAGAAPQIDRLIAESAKKIDNIAAKLTEDRLAAASREVNGGMKIAKEGGGFFDHVTDTRNLMNGLNKQATHLERLVGRSRLSESHIRTINGLIERARGLAGRALQAITPKEPI